MRYVLHTTVEQGHSPVEGIEHSSDSLPQHVVVAGPGADRASPRHEVLEVASPVAGLANRECPVFQVPANDTPLRQQQNPTRVESARVDSPGKKAELPVHSEHPRASRPENREDIHSQAVDEPRERVRMSLVLFHGPVLKNERPDPALTQRLNQIASKLEWTSLLGPDGTVAGR